MNINQILFSLNVQNDLFLKLIKDICHFHSLETNFIHSFPLFLRKTVDFSINQVYLTMKTLEFRVLISNKTRVFFNLGENAILPTQRNEWKWTTSYSRYNSQW